MRRLWTLQEAMLARCLVFEFANGKLLHFQDLQLVAKSDYNNPVVIEMYAELYTIVENRRDGEKVTMEALGHLLAWRATSKPADEVPAIISLLDVDDDTVGKIIELPPSSRMQTLLLALGSIVEWIVFQGGLKLTEPGFRGAPVTFMSVASGQDASTTAPKAYVSPSGVVGPQGLTASFLVFDLGQEHEIGRDAWYVSKPGSEGRKDFIIGGSWR